MCVCALLRHELIKLIPNVRNPYRDMFATSGWLGNYLTALPREIGHLTLLTSLNLRNNRLQLLPSEIGSTILLCPLLYGLLLTLACSMPCAMQASETAHRFEPDRESPYLAPTRIFTAEGTASPPDL